MTSATLTTGVTAPVPVPGVEPVLVPEGVVVPLGVVVLEGVVVPEGVVDVPEAAVAPDAGVDALVGPAPPDVAAALVAESPRPIYLEDSFTDLHALEGSPWKYEVISAARTAELIRSNDYLIRL